MKFRFSSFGLVLAVFVAVMFVSGCIGGEEEIPEQTFEGAKGIKTSFTPGAPTSNVVEGEKFRLSLKLENEGEDSVDSDEMKVFIRGVNPNVINLDTDDISKAPASNLSGAHYFGNNTVPGGIAYIDWENLNYSIPVDSDEKLNFVAHTCYYYKTRSNARLCFSSNTYAQTTGTETCSVIGSKDFSNWAAPIQVTKVIENPAGRDKYAIQFTIENLGSGNAFQKELDLEDCVGVSTSDLHYITLKEVVVGGEEQDCNGGIGEMEPRDIRLVDGKTTVNCIIKQEDIVGDYTDDLRLEIEYGYFTQETKEVTVKNLLFNN